LSPGKFCPVLPGNDRVASRDRFVSMLPCREKDMPVEIVEGGRRKADAVRLPSFEDYC